MWSASQFSRLAAGRPRSSTSLVTGPADAPSFSGYGCSFRFPSRLHGAELPRQAAFCLTCAFLHRPQTELTHFPVFRTRRGGRTRFFISLSKKSLPAFFAKPLSELQNQILQHDFAILPLRRVIERERTP